VYIKKLIIGPYCETSHGYSQEMNKRGPETASDERLMYASTRSWIFVCRAYKLKY